jgi:hypothetical protein
MVELNMFDFEKLNEDCFIVVFGKRSSGKTVLCKDITRCKAANDNSRSLAFAPSVAPPVAPSVHFVDDNEKLYLQNLVVVTTDCATGENINSYEEFEKAKIHNTFDMAIVDNFWKAAKGRHRNKKTMLILDNCVPPSFLFAQHRTMNKLLFNGRHYQSSLIMTFGNCAGIPPQHRDQFDYIFMFKETNPSVLRKLYDDYVFGCYSYEMFEEWMIKYTEEDYMCLVIDRRLASIFRRGETANSPICWYKTYGESYVLK